jgi:hypothetical protein
MPLPMPCLFVAVLRAAGASWSCLVPVFRCCLREIGDGSITVSVLSS